MAGASKARRAIKNALIVTYCTAISKKEKTVPLKYFQLKQALH